VAPAPLGAVPAPRSVSQAGRHQFQRPINRMVAGTSSVRTMVASTTTAMPIPTPTAWMMTDRASPKPKNTVAMIAAAPVIKRPVRSRPTATARALSPFRSYSSRTRLSSRTS